MRNSVPDVNHTREERWISGWFRARHGWKVAWIVSPLDVFEELIVMFGKTTVQLNVVGQEGWNPRGLSKKKKKKKTNREASMRVKSVFAKIVHRSP